MFNREELREEVSWLVDVQGAPYDHADKASTKILKLIEPLIESHELWEHLDEVSGADLWVARESLLGRGFRVHNVCRREASEFGLPTAGTAREAVKLHKESNR